MPDDPFGTKMEFSQGDRSPGDVMVMKGMPEPSVIYFGAREIVTPYMVLVLRAQPYT